MAISIQINITDEQKVDFIVLCNLHHLDYKTVISGYIKGQLKRPENIKKLEEFKSKTAKHEF